MCYPTDKMVSDYSSKPNQRVLFEFQRNTILGIKKEDFGSHKNGMKKC